MNDVLLTVGGHIPADISDQIARGERPLTDYVAMSDIFSADLIDYTKARQILGLPARLLGRILGKDFILALACFKLRRHYRVIFTDGENVGILLALLFKFFSTGYRPRHLMISHILSVPKKMFFFDKLHIQRYIDLFLVYSTNQKKFIEDRWDITPDRVVFTPFMVDTDFFAPNSAETTIRDELPLKNPEWPIVSAVGLEFRDYPTLMQAIKGLEINVVIASGSPWSKRKDSTKGKTIPDNVILQRFTQYDLRRVYADSAFFIMPLIENEFQAGVTALLEAMAMGKAIICSKTRGQTDVVLNGKTGIYVPPQDPNALRAAITFLMEVPEEAAEMGLLGRQRVVDSMSLTHYVARLNQYIQAARHNTLGKEAYWPS